MVFWFQGGESSKILACLTQYYAWLPIFITTYHQKDLTGILRYYRLKKDSSSQVLCPTMKHSSQSDRVINPILCILILDCIVAPWKLFFLVSHGFRIHTRNNWCFCGTFSVQIVILVQKSHRSIFQGSLLFFLLSIARLYLEHNPLRVY